MGRKSAPKTEDVTSVAVEAKHPKKVKRKAAEQVVEKEERKKKKQKKAAKEASTVEVVEVKTEGKKKKKKKMIKNQEMRSSDDTDSSDIQAVLAAKKKDKIWDDTSDSSDKEDIFEKSDSDCDVIEESNDVMVYIPDGSYMDAYLDDILRELLSRCGQITRITVYGHDPSDLDRKACITFTTKEAAESALELDQAELDGTPVTIKLLQGNLGSNDSGDRCGRRPDSGLGHL